MIQRLPFVVLYIVTAILGVISYSADRPIVESDDLGITSVMSLFMGAFMCVIGSRFESEFFVFAKSTALGFSVGRIAVTLVMAATMRMPWGGFGLEVAGLCQLLIAVCAIPIYELYPEMPAMISPVARYDHDK